jgi:glycosyltransferase involved in cell wall biosynthesis
MGICLNMIVRNESANLPTLFASLEGQVDYFVIADTGSTDGTPELIAALSNRHGIPGTVTRHPWIDFSTNRNLVLQDALALKQDGAHHCNWLMILDADEELRVDRSDWREKLKSGVSYSVMTRGLRLSVSRLCLLWLPDNEWIWKGRIHNYVAASEHDKYEHIDDICIQTHPFRGAKSKGFSNGVMKAVSDTAIMAAELEGIKPGREHAHRFFQWAHVLFLGGSLLDAGEIFSQLAKDPQIGNGIRYASAILAGRCGMTMPEGKGSGESWFDLALSMDPDRREALFYKALEAMSTDKNASLAFLDEASGIKAPNGSIFYLEHDLYDWRTDYQRILLHASVGEKTKAAQDAQRLINTVMIPEPEVGFLKDVIRRGLNENE